MKPDISKLPKWAQEHIKDLQRQRDAAVRTLNEFQDSDTPSQFYFEEFVCSGESQGPTAKRRYIQTHSLVCEWRGVRLRIAAHEYSNIGTGIYIQWEGLDHRDVAFVPCSHQSAHLRSIGDMR